VKQPLSVTAAADIEADDVGPQMIGSWEIVAPYAGRVASGEARGEVSVWGVLYVDWHHLFVL